MRRVYPCAAELNSYGLSYMSRVTFSSACIGRGRSAWLPGRSLGAWPPRRRVKTSLSGFQVWCRRSLDVVEHRGLVERFLTLQHAGGLLAVELADPLPNDHRGYRVAGEVGQRTGLGHEPVDPYDQADAVVQVGAV